MSCDSHFTSPSIITSPFAGERGEEPDKPFSGQFVTRISPELHRQINLAATLAGKSLNAFVTEQSQAAVDKQASTKAVET
nr:toxin-antitoxin system HicB family antitoxin [Rubinisphaera brasiliensis]